MLTRYTMLATLASLAAAAAHNESVLASSDAVEFAGVWGAFTPLLPLKSCAPDTVPRVATPTADNGTRVSYTFSGGSAAYVSLVLGRDVCGGTFSVDGADKHFTSSAGDDMACVVVAGAGGLDPAKEHTISVRLDAHEGVDLVCPFIFARFLVTKPGEGSSESSSSSPPPTTTPETTPGTTTTDGSTNTATDDSPTPSQTEPPNAAQRLTILGPAVLPFMAALLLILV